MAEKKNVVPENVPGKFFVDSQCIDCDLCRETAPANFKRHETAGYSFVYQQPTSAEEAEACLHALSGCPVDAIGTDGA